MTLADRVWTGFWLGVLTYLGFYVFGLVMGVYTPSEVPYFTIPAAVLAALYLVHATRGRRAASGGGDDETARLAHRLREGRGF
jgi:hypothetical protein